MNYQEALDYIYAFANFETRPAHQLRRADYTLDRIRRLLEALENPHTKYPTVHIAGTKGKGSVAAMIASVLQAAGYRVGLFTSPHLHTYRERVRVDGQLIGEKEVVDWITNRRPLLDRLGGLTTFEVTTALAFDTFTREQVDIAVIEVGLGGRVDTTNVITPLVAVITPISLDHTAILGSTIAEIAADKAGIIKPGVPVVTALQPPEAMAVIRGAAQRLAAPLIRVGRDWTWERGAVDLRGQTFHARRLAVPVALPAHPGHALDMPGSLVVPTGASTPDRALRDLWVPLLGEHQLVNAATALATVGVLDSRGFPVSQEEVRHGLSTVEWPGRLEVLGRDPTVVVDGAHNDASARELRHAVEELFAPQRIILVFGASADKDISGMLEVLLPAAEEIIVTRARHPRAADPMELAAAVQFHDRAARIVPTVDQALINGVELAGPEDLVLVTGSLFVVAEAREAWLRALGAPLPPRDPPKRDR